MPIFFDFVEEGIRKKQKKSKKKKKKKKDGYLRQFSGS